MKILLFCITISLQTEHAFFCSTFCDSIVAQLSACVSQCDRCLTMMHWVFFLMNAILIVIYCIKSMARAQMHNSCLDNVSCFILSWTTILDLYYMQSIIICKVTSHLVFGVTDSYSAMAKICWECDYASI